MCRGVEHVATDARRPLADLLATIAGRLAAEHGVPAGEVRIGPVDFGPDACDKTGATTTSTPDSHVP